MAQAKDVFVLLLLFVGFGKHFETVSINNYGSELLLFPSLLFLFYLVLNVSQWLILMFCKQLTLMFYE